MPPFQCETRMVFGYCGLRTQQPMCNTGRRMSTGARVEMAFGHSKNKTVFGR